MHNRIKRNALLSSIAAACLSATLHPAMAAEYVVGYEQVGGYYGPYLPDDFGTPPPDPFPAPPAPDIDPADQVYFMGRSTFSTTTSERRVYFIYDMSSLSIPFGEDITSVEIDLVLLDGGTSALANFTGDIEIVEFSGTTFTKEEILDETPADPIAIWDSFGTGPSYGAFELVSTEHPTLDPTIPGTYSISLPGSIPDVTDAIAAGDYFVLTARLATYDPDPILPGPTDEYEYVFGLTDVVDGGFETSLPPPDLSITTVPEPSALALLGLGGLIVMRRRRA